MCASPGMVYSYHACAHTHGIYYYLSHTKYISSPKPHSQQHEQEINTCAPTHKHKYIHTCDSGAVYGRGPLCVCLCDTLSHSRLYSFTLLPSLTVSRCGSRCPSGSLARSLALSLSLSLSHTLFVALQFQLSLLLCFTPTH